MADTYEVRRGDRVLNIADRQPTFWRRFADGSWEPETLALLDRLLSPTSTFVDIGAWVGPTSLWAAFSARRIMALEADPVALEQLRCNLAANTGLAGRIEIIPKAIHPSPGKVSLGAQRKPGDSMSSTLLTGSRTVWQAEAITPGELAGRIGPDEDLIVKMDIEGGEYNLIPHMGPLLQKSRAVIISFHPQLARTALGWDEDQLRLREGAVLDFLADFERSPVVGRSPGRATFEMLFIRP